MAIEVVSFSSNSMVIFRSYVSYVATFTRGYFSWTSVGCLHTDFADLHKLQAATTQSQLSTLGLCSPREKHNMIGPSVIYQDEFSPTRWRNLHVASPLPSSLLTSWKVQNLDYASEATAPRTALRLDHQGPAPSLSHGEKDLEKDLEKVWSVIWCLGLFVRARNYFLFDKTNLQKLFPWSCEQNHVSDHVWSSFPGPMDWGTAGLRFSGHVSAQLGGDHCGRVAGRCQRHRPGSSSAPILQSSLAISILGRIYLSTYWLST